MPKGVINTQRMICANQVMISFRVMCSFLKDQRRIMVDWLPWNHTFGVNHNVGMRYTNGWKVFI